LVVSSSGIFENWIGYPIAVTTLGTEKAHGAKDHVGKIKIGSVFAVGTGKTHLTNIHMHMRFMQFFHKHVADLLTTLASLAWKIYQLSHKTGYLRCAKIFTAM
jgi:hypothetical protein